MFTMLQVFAQTTVTGVVTDEGGEAIPGVNVMVKGVSGAGTITDIDGKYTLKVPADATTLIFSFVGLEKKEEAIGGRTSINVTLKASSENLDEVVVMGYVSHNKNEVTGAAVSVDNEAIESIPVSSVDQALQGKVAGLTVSTSSGTPGSTQKLRVRGISSITSDNSPLYVIDGVPVIEGNVSASSANSSLSILSTINSSDIESMTILKDASATAAYGARGANGVIVITTKSGKSGKAKFNFSAYYGWQNDAIDGPEVLTNEEQMTLNYEALMNSFGISKENVAQVFADNFGDKYIQWEKNGRPEPHWGDVITNKNAPTQSYDLSVSGGNEKSRYYVSLGYFSQEGTVIGASFDRVSGKVNFTKDLGGGFTFTTNNTASYTYQDGLLEQSAYYSSPRTAKFFIPASDLPYNKDGSINLNTGMPNPLYIAAHNLDDSKYVRVLTNDVLTWDTPVENLKYTLRVNLDHQNMRFIQYRNMKHGDGEDSNGSAYQTAAYRTNFVIQNSVDYSFNTGDIGTLDLKLLQEYQKNQSYFLEAESKEFVEVGLTNMRTSAKPTTASSEAYDWMVASYLGMAHYSLFDAKYVFDATFRLEGNSRFISDNRWGKFWALGAAWNIYKEAFLENATFISTLKLRASYGVTGNAGVGLNKYQTKVAYDANYKEKGASYLKTLGNNDLSWEISKTLDLGLDFGFFKDRITGTVAYYRRESQDLLLEVPLSYTTGFSKQARNIGRMENKGIEANVSFDIVRTNDFNVTIGGNVAFNQNEVLELAKDLKGNDIEITSSTRKVAVGHPVYGWYMPEWARVNPDTGEDEWYVNREKSDKLTTNFNDADQVWNGGSALPTVTAGLNLHVDYKGIFLDVSAYYAGGHKIYEGWHRYINNTTIYSSMYMNGINTILDRWQKPGDVARFKKMEWGTVPWQRHTKYLHDGDFIRLKDVTIGYDLPSTLLKSIKVTGLRVFARGTNMFTWVKDEWLVYDPEVVNAYGETGLTTPPVKSIIFGINLKF